MKKLLLIVLSLSFSAAYAETCYELNNTPGNLSNLSAPKTVCLDDVNSDGSVLTASMKVDGKVTSLEVKVSGNNSFGASPYKTTANIYAANYNVMGCSDSETVVLTLSITQNFQGQVTALNELTGTSSSTSDNCHVAPEVESFSYTQI